MPDKTDSFTRKKLILFSLIPSIVVLLLIAAIAEVGLRVKFRTIESITGIAGWKEVVNGIYTYYGDIYHPTRGWTNRPGYRSDPGRPNKVAINSQGLRSHREISLQPDAGLRRIAIIGDSFTFGDEVNNDQTLPHYLEQFLDATEC